MTLTTESEGSPMSLRRFSRGLVVAVFTAGLAVCAVGASAALAAPEWYSSTVKPAPEWQQGKAKMSEAVATKSKGKVKLYDTGVDSEVECEGAAEGTAGSGAADKTTSWKLSSCKATSKAINKKGEETTNLCEKADSAKVELLPWKGELALSRGSLVNELKATSGSLAYSVTCEIKELGKITDTCEYGELSIFSPKVANASGGVNESFDVGGLTCTEGGSDAGKFETTQLVEATKGSTLEANVIEGTYSKVTSSIPVTSTLQDLVLEDKEDSGVSPLGVVCYYDIEGTVGTGGKGTITSVAGLTCTGVGNCGTVNEVQANNLPWNTELYEAEGHIRDRIVSSGKGTPEYRFVCEVKGVKTTDECGLNVAPELVNRLEGNVLDVFSESLTKTKCTHNTKEAGVWHGEVNFVPEKGAIKVK